MGKGTRLFTTKCPVEILSAESTESKKKYNGENPLPSDQPKATQIYKDATTRENLEEAFRSLKAKSSPGIDGETKVKFGATLTRQIDNLYKDLKKHKYQPGPIKVVHIPKPEGGKRPLGISSVRDKIVQAALKKELEKRYEPIFSGLSFGFRPKLSCHSALKRIKKHWQAIKWLIKLDIKKCFDRIQHDSLIEVLQQQVNDQELVDLLRKMFKVGYVDVHNLTKREEYKTEGTPQGSIISPLLCNVFLHELDKFIEDTLIPSFTKGEKRKADKAKIYQRDHVLKEELKENPIINEFPQLKEIIPVLKRNKQHNENKSHHYKKGPYYKRMHYVRYADDILTGVVGTKEDCRKILRKINRFLQDKLKLELNIDKCEINLAREENTLFLGYLIGRYGTKVVSKSEVRGGIEMKVLQAVAINPVALMIPTKQILKRLTDRGYVRKLPKSNRYKGRGVGRLTYASDRKIVEFFSSMIRGYVNYYVCANRRSKL